jgi:EAL domain-containing protein (putative c-di-GMP-specific phosphodiesterase class I)
MNTVKQRQETITIVLMFYSTSPALDIQITRENEISQEITEISAVSRPTDFILQFQPIFNIAANRISRFEALARLNSEKHGLVLPLEFISVAEKQT